MREKVYGTIICLTYTLIVGIMWGLYIGGYGVPLFAVILISIYTIFRIVVEFILWKWSEQQNER